MFAPSIDPGRHPARFLWLWAALFALLMAFSLDNSYPYMGDESYYTVSALNMRERGDLHTPWYEGEYRFNKPILAYWAVLAGHAAFGVSMWSGRVPVLLLSLATLAMTFRLAVDVTGDRRQGVLAAALLSSSYLFISFSRVAMTDPVLTFFATAALCCYVRMVASPERPLRWAAAAAAACGLGCLTKGLVGLLPLGGLLLYLVLARPPRALRLAGAALHPACWAMLALVVAPWYLHVAGESPQEFSADLLSERAVLRAAFAPAALLKRFAFYAGNLVGTYLPFSVAAAFVAIRRRPPRASLRSLPACHVLATVAVFVVFVQMNKARYLLPAFPALSVVFAQILMGERWRRWVGAAAAVCVLQGAAFAAYPLVSHENLKVLVRHWQRTGAGPLGFDLDAQKAGWGRLYAGDRDLAAPAAARYVIVDEPGRSRYGGWSTLRNESRVVGLRWSGEAPLLDRRTLYLLERPAGAGR
jgi:4-amino-4-deoxy-L-arabinose transferase-like glycosyltransferase